MNCTGERLTATPTSCDQPDRVHAGLAQHPLADRNDQAGFFRQRNEIDRRDHAAQRMVPAHQRFEGDDDVLGDVADRLVIDFEFFALKRGAQVDFQQPPGLRARVHPGLEEAIGAAAVLLGAIEREIGFLEQFVGILAVLGRQRNADADADDELVTGDLVGRGNLLDHVAGEQGDGGRIAIAAELHDREFVAAEPRHRVIFGDALAEAAARLPSAARRRPDGRANR